MQEPALAPQYDGDTRTARAEPGRQAEASYHEPMTASPLSLGAMIVSAWRHRLIFLLVFAAAFAVACAVVLSLRPSYQSEATLMIDPRQSHLTNLQSIQDGAATLSDLNFVRTEMQVLSGDDLAHRVVTQLGLQDEPQLQNPPSPLAPLLARLGLQPGPSDKPSGLAQSANEATARYKEHFGTFSDGKSFIISAWFAAPDPALAQRVLQTHLMLFQAEQIATKRAAITRAEQWFDNELQSLQAKLLASEAKQQAFRESNRLFRAAGETTSSRQLAAVTNQLINARLDLALKEARVREISSGANRAARPDTAGLSSDLLQKLREQEASEAQLVAQLSHRFDQSHPTLAAARLALADLQARIAREGQRIVEAASGDLAIARANVAQLEASQNSLTTLLGATSKDELTASQLEREVDADRRLYDELLSRSKQVGIQEQLQEPDTRIVSAASMPLRPTFPRKGMLLTVSAAAAALLAAVITVLVDRLGDNRSRSVPDIEAACGLPSLAVIPHQKRGRGLAMPLKPGTALAAALQTLHNSIVLRPNGRRPKVTVFTSALPGEGKSLLAMLYARSLASPEHRVLLVDADLRRAGLSTMLGLTRGGIRDCLGGQPLAACVHQDVLPGLDVLSALAGQSDPAALLSAERIRTLFGQAVQHYAAVIFDVPPILAVDDCLHLVQEAHSTVLIVRWGRTPLAVLNSAVRRLRLAQANLVGVVVNGADLQRLHAGAGHAYPGAYFLASR